MSTLFLIDDHKYMFVGQVVDEFDDFFNLFGTFIVPSGEYYPHIHYLDKVPKSKVKIIGEVDEEEYYNLLCNLN